MGATGQGPPSLCSASSALTLLASLWRRRVGTLCVPKDPPVLLSSFLPFSLQEELPGPGHKHPGSLRALLTLPRAQTSELESQDLAQVTTTLLPPKGPLTALRREPVAAACKEHALYCRTAVDSELSLARLEDRTGPGTRDSAEHHHKAQGVLGDLRDLPARPGALVSNSLEIGGQLDPCFCCQKSRFGKSH